MDITKCADCRWLEYNAIKLLKEYGPILLAAGLSGLPAPLHCSFVRGDLNNSNALCCSNPS